MEYILLNKINLEHEKNLQLIQDYLNKKNKLSTLLRYLLTIEDTENLFLEEELFDVFNSTYSLVNFILRLEAAFLENQLSFVVIENYPKISLLNKSLILKQYPKINFLKNVDDFLEAHSFLKHQQTKEQFFNYATIYGIDKAINKFNLNIDYTESWILEYNLISSYEKG